jgi:predicted RNase H-like HicB family nuclease
MLKSNHDRSPRAYSLMIDYIKDDDMYVAWFPALPGCRTCSTDYEDVISRAREAMTGYLEAWAKSGRRLPIEQAVPRGVSLAMLVDVPAQA